MCSLEQIPTTRSFAIRCNIRCVFCFLSVFLLFRLCGITAVAFVPAPIPPPPHASRLRSKYTHFFAHVFYVVVFVLCSMVNRACECIIIHNADTYRGKNTQVQKQLRSSRFRFRSLHLKRESRVAKWVGMAHHSATIFRCFSCRWPCSYKHSILVGQHTYSLVHDHDRLALAYIVIDVYRLESIYFCFGHSGVVKTIQREKQNGSDTFSRCLFGLLRCAIFPPSIIRFLDSSLLLFFCVLLLPVAYCLCLEKVCECHCVCGCCKAPTGNCCCYCYCCSSSFTPSGLAWSGSGLYARAIFVMSVVAMNMVDINLVSLH